MNYQEQTNNSALELIQNIKEELDPKDARAHPSTVLSPSSLQFTAEDMNMSSKLSPKSMLKQSLSVIHEGLLNDTLNSQQAQVQLSELRSQMQMKECTFRPQITPHGSHSKSPHNPQHTRNSSAVHEKLYK